MNTNTSTKPIEKKKLFSVKNILTTLALAVVIYIVIKTDFSAIWAEIKALPLWVLAVLIGLQLVTQFTLNYQWYRLCKVLGLRANFFRLLAINAFGMVADAITPGEKVGGEVARVVQLNRMLGFDTKQSTSLVTIQKSLSLTALIILNIVALFTLSNHFEFLKPLPTRIVLYTVLGLLAIFFLYLLFFTSRMNTWVQKRKPNGKIMTWIKSWMNSFATDTKQISKNPREWVFQLFLSFGIWVLFPMKLLILVSQFGKVGILILFAATFVSYFAAMIPLLPGGLGTFEATMSGILIVYGLTLQESVAISLVFRFITFWFVVLFSLVVIAIWKVHVKIRENSHEK